MIIRNGIFLFAGFLVFLLSCKKDRPELPIVTTLQIYNINDTSAVSGGEIESDGGSKITSRGVCWGINQNPTINDNKTTDGEGIGNFTSTLKGLKSKTSYYVRAYATNSAGTGYGKSVSFTTLQLSILATSPVLDITETSASCGGNIIDDGGTAITARGVCWSVNPNPTISDNKTTDGLGTGAFTSKVTGLLGNQTYYIRAYATNSAGVSYSSVQSFVTLPDLKIVAVSNVTSTAVTLTEDMSNNGTVPILSRGFCWSTTPHPTTANNKTNGELGSGNFNGSVTGLSAFVKYYVRAFVINNSGTFYGVEQSFVTKSSITVTDVDGNVYSTVQIGTQIWLAENLKSTHYANGDPIQNVVSNWSNLITTGAYCNYNYDESNVAVYGRLYNGFAVNESRNICPAGWHVPSSLEWTTLINYLGGKNIAGGKMKDTDTIHWISPNTNASNTIGFLGLPGGYIDQNSIFSDLGKKGYWWASFQGASDLLDFFRLDNDNGIIYDWLAFKHSAFSVRCTKD